MADLKAQLEAMRAAKQANPQPAGAPVATSDTQKAPVDLKAQLAQMRAQKQAPAEKKDGFIVGTLKSIGKSFAEPAVAAYNVAQTAKPVARGIASRIAGDRAAEQQAIQETETQLGQSRNLPFLGKTKPAFAENAMSGNDLGMAKEVIGRGADVASNIIGGGGVAAIGKQTLKGAVKQAAKTGLKEGAIVGGMSGFGTELQQKDSTVGGVLGSTAAGAALGAVAGAGLGAGGALAREGIVGGVKLAQKPFRSLETKTAEAIDSAIDKGLKPSVKKTAEKSQQFRTQAREAFNVINEYRPTLAREGEEAGVRNPENRAEMLDALQQAKKQLFNEYDNLTRESGEIGAKFDPTPILHRLDNISRDKAYNTETRAYAVKLMDEVGELKGENFGVVQERIKDFNSSLAGYYEGRVNKSKARLDASVASLMREITDTQVNSLTGGNWQGLRNKYGSLSAIERDLERQVAVEARKNAAGFFDITDIFTGGDLTAGILTANPALIARGMAGRGIKEAIKWVNNPNRYIKNAFELLNKQPVTKEMRVRPKIAGLLPERATPAPIQAGAPGELERQAANRAAGERIFSPDAMKQAPMPEKPKIAGLLPAARKTASDINQGRPIQVAPRNVEYTGPEKVAGSFKAPQRIIEGEVVKSNYRYHSTSPKALESIRNQGLKPSRGQYGKGVYFAPDIEGTKGWGSEEGVLMRTKKSELPKDYQEFDEQGWTSKTVPPDALEVSTDGGKTWMSLVQQKPKKAAGVLKLKTPKVEPKSATTFDKHGTPLSQNGKSLGDPVSGGVYYHGTVKENKPSLLKNGFDTAMNKKGFAEQPEALYVGSYSEASMYGDDMVGVRVKPGQEIKTLSSSSKEWAETVGKSTNKEETAAALREMRSRGYDAINNGNEIEILNLKKFEIIDAKKEKSLYEQVTGKKPPTNNDSVAGVLKKKVTEKLGTYNPDERNAVEVAEALGFKKFAKEMGGKDEAEDFAQQFWSKKGKDGVYYHVGPEKISSDFDPSKSRYDGSLRGKGISQINGLYLGKDQQALNDFYGMRVRDELMDDATVSEFKIQPKWLDLSNRVDEDAFLKKVEEKYNVKSGTAKFGDALIKEVAASGYDGVRYFDPYATGEEFVLTKPLSELKRGVVKGPLPKKKK